ncbi:hypothetical protein F5Y18DRAFT_439990 [Xylariaceae sp. FL1019]|nr:hypothetical protein F5Y18DRAFT_439990 [Xylariaceae sp. FL1019]
MSEVAPAHFDASPFHPRAKNEPSGPGSMARPQPCRPRAHYYIPSRFGENRVCNEHTCETGCITMHDCMESFALRPVRDCSAACCRTWHEAAHNVHLNVERIEMSCESECNNRTVGRWLQSLIPKATLLNVRLTRLSVSRSEPPSLASKDIFDIEQGANLYTATTSAELYRDERRSKDGTGFDGPQSSLGENVPPLSPSDASSTALSSSLLKEDLSDPEPPPPTRDIDGCSATNNRNIDQGITGPKLVDGGEAEDSPRQGQAVHWSKLKSCPDLQQEAVAVVPTINPRLSVDQGCGINIYNYTKFDDDRHQHHFHIPATISKRFRDLRRKFRRSKSSSTFSMRSDFPAPPGGRERRYLSRVSTDIWPSSGEESVIFNTPDSNGSPIRLGHGSYTDSSIASGLMTELDRLSTSLNSSDRPGSPEMNLGQIHIPSGMAGPESENGVSDIFSNNSLNSPSLAFSHSSLTSPVPRPLQGRKRRGQQSRLSEVTTPEDLRSPAEPADDSRLQSPQMTSMDNSVFLDCERHGNLVPEPSSISQTVSSGPNHKDDISELMSEEIAYNAHFCSMPPGHEANSRSLLQTLDEDKELSTKTSAIQTELMRCIDAVTGETLPGGERLVSCHPDTWTEEQGEPGDSDPFCPPECLSTQPRHKKS